ncbi:PaaI family thioesterase [Hyphomonas sp.]|uniref:PaaI family thioesterase n=1 Tax=Hyphomonas sp. TaxID=87 RepID=UPI003D29A3C3
MSYGDPMTDKSDIPQTGLDQVLAMIARDAGAPIGETLGFSIIHAEDGKVIVEGHPDHRVYNPMGSVHGGYAATLLDTACALCVHTTLPAGRAHTTLELKTSYLRGLTVESGPVRATGKVISAGRRVAFSEASLEDAQGRICATATSTVLLFDVAPDSPKAFRA